MSSATSNRAPFIFMGINAVTLPTGLTKLSQLIPTFDNVFRIPPNLLMGKTKYIKAFKHLHSNQIYFISRPLIRFSDSSVTAIITQCLIGTLIATVKLSAILLQWNVLLFGNPNRQKRYSRKTSIHETTNLLLFSSIII